MNSSNSPSQLSCSTIHNLIFPFPFEFKYSSSKEYSTRFLSQWTKTSSPSLYKFMDRVQAVIISHKNRLSRIGFKLFRELFKEFGTEIVMINELESVSTEQEMFQEIISFLLCYAMTISSRKRKEKRKEFTKKKVEAFKRENII
ncbi:MAG: hypothetical protein ACFFD2_13695 [Promethearchaeota archaeon]